MSAYNVAIAGATGAVGTEFLKLLEERDFPLATIKLLASSRSAGRKLSFCGRDYVIEELTETSFQGVDVAFFSAGGSRSKQFADAAVRAGALVIDNSSAYRMDPAVPLVVPEVNPEDIGWNRGIIANPNCSTIIMLMAVAPLRKLGKIKRIVVATYQAASGAGAAAMQELVDQSRQILAGEPVTKAIFPHQIAFNLFSHNTKIDEDGYNEEERKMIKETRKILHDESLLITATCVRVPILRAHSESVNIEFEGARPEISEVVETLAAFPNVRVVDDREMNHFPMPVEASGRDETLVGRVRRDLSNPNAIDLFVCGDQILKGAALNGFQIAEEWIRQGAPIQRVD